MKLKELFKDERPREKLICKGADTLSNAELVAILLRTGTGKMNVLDLGREVMKTVDGSLIKLSSLSIDKLLEIPGIGQEKASIIIAAFELGKRFSSETCSTNKISITNPSMIYELMLPKLKGLDHEECWVIFLNKANYIISKDMISSGGIDSTIIDNKMILRMGLEKRASSIILIHNHPSGSPRPGNNDIQQTDLLKKALNQVDISLLDHIVVSDDSFFSFADNSVTIAKNDGGI